MVGKRKLRQSRVHRNTPTLPVDVCIYQASVNKLRIGSLSDSTIQHIMRQHTPKTTAMPDWRMTCRHAEVNKSFRVDMLHMRRQR